ncbi:hypothetical protein GQ473_06070 [archaeon]|nr:hypothetical protein [archaeon]
MQKSYNPKLVTLFGDENQTVNLKNILTNDEYYNLLSGDFSNENTEYLEYKYPELLGLPWAKIAQVAIKIGTVVGGAIGSVVRKRRAERKRKKAQQAIEQENRRKIAIQNYMIMQQKQKQRNKLLMFGVAGLGIYYMMGKK